MRLSARSLVLVAALSVAASTSAAAFAADIDFSVGGAGTGKYDAASGITSSTIGPAAFTTYTEYGITVTTGLTSGLEFNSQQCCGIAPSLTGGDPIESSGGTGLLTITEGGSLFNLDSFQLEATGASTADWFVYVNGLPTDIVASGADSSSGLQTITFDLPTADYSSISIKVEDGSLYYVDNIVVTTPEPSSLLLLGTGLIGLGAFARRRFAL